MIRTKIAFLITAAFALTLTMQEGNSASFNATGALKETVVGANLVQKVHIYGCHTNCRWGWYKAGNGKVYTGCHSNTWTCAWASPCNPKACRWWHWWRH
jgi:hypothetical protein